jgi:hypothetical protein
MGGGARARLQQLRVRLPARNQLLPRAKHDIEELAARPDLSDKAKQAIFHDNVMRFYGR